MSSTFPSVLTSYTNPQATDRLNNPSHSGIETNQNSGLGSLEAFIGTLSSVQGTLMYDIRAAASNGGGHVQTANKGGTGQTVFTKGDVLVGQSSSVLTKVAVGSDATALLADSTQSAGVRWGVPGKFGGTGVDGALAISSGTTTIDLANASTVIKNYTSISITGTGVLAFSNPNTNGTLIYLKSQGNVTITSSATPAIDVRLVGGQASEDGLGAPSTYTQGGDSTAGNNVAGAAGVCNLPLSGRLGKTIALAPGGGGGNGAATNGGGGSKPGGAGGGAGAAASGTAGVAGSGTTAIGAGTPGAGGRGGGCLVVECQGALNITGIINASGENGVNAASADNATGGGGGGGGSIFLLYNTLTANTGTYTVSAGTAGTSTSNGISGAGGAGKSLVVLNTEIT